MENKTNLIKNLLLLQYLSSGLLACTEFSNGADVFAVNKRHYATEIEVKTSRSDLLREFKIIVAALTGGKSHWRTATKLNKHRGYLEGWGADVKYYCFAVTPELEDTAKVFILKHNLPYGLLVLMKMGSYYNSAEGETYFIKTVIKSKRISKEKCSMDTVMMVARRACWEVYTLRKKRLGKVNDTSIQKS